ncbi:unnamed protein product, partial [Symbiodinium microadriaticum]
VDIKRDATSDLLDSANWDKIFTEITAGEWDVLLLSPPCSTWSRARFRYAGKFGAKPLRSSTYVWGFPWLEASQRELADRGNFFIHQCIRAVKLQLSVGKFFLWEHPEDLGTTSQGDHPASIWQLPEVRALGANAATWALHQCNFGGSSSKPTRLLSNLPAALPLHMGWPKFSTSGSYDGPLPRCPHKWHEPLVGWQGDAYRTSGAEAYPPPLCQYFANLIMSLLHVLSSTEDLHVSNALPSAEDLAKLLPPGHLTTQDVTSLVPLLELEEPHLATGQKAGGAFFAGAYAKGGLVGLPFTSLAIFVNVQTKMHKDVYNAWEGNRVVLIGFSVRHTDDLPLEQLQLLRDLGFQLPSAPVAQGEEGAVGGQSVADTLAGPVIRDPVDHSALGAMDLMHAKEPHEFVDGLGLCSPGR